MKIWREVFRKNRGAVLVFCVITVGNAVVFTLYGIMTEPLFYAAFLAAFLLLILLLTDFLRERQKAVERLRLIEGIGTEWNNLPETGSPMEADYQEMIKRLGDMQERLLTQENEKRQDMLDYYTAWVHQIKTPIAVMRLKLSEDTAEHRALSAELQRIEQYVDMVLQYIRVSSESSDLVIREYQLDDLIREAVRKQATQFVERHLRLSFEPTGKTIITDEKWFVCILDQLLSNAVKYTPSGAVSIAEEDGVLKIADTGIGIAPEDLPRIFEKGYTGRNGRIDQKASGLGLYLAKKAADLLTIPLAAESTPGEGSTFYLNLREKYKEI